MKRFVNLGAAGLALLSWTLTACHLASGTPSPQSARPEQPEEAQDLAASPNPHIRLHANLLSAAKWLQRDRIVYICWENANPSDSAPAAVKAAIDATWQRESALKFQGWQPCAQRSRGIRIRVDDSGPHTKGLGRQLDGRDAGMVLNFTFRNWSPSCQSNRDSCIKSIAVHEFGHAIGFAHEQNRSDAPGECQTLRQGGDGDLLLTPYDPRSVMNYCNAKYNNDGQLSLLDISAVRELYGIPGAHQ